MEWKSISFFYLDETFLRLEKVKDILESYFIHHIFFEFRRNSKSYNLKGKDANKVADKLPVFDYLYLLANTPTGYIFPCCDASCFLHDSSLLAISTLNLDNLLLAPVTWPLAVSSLHLDF